ncbi:TPA: hypothetical protein DCX16_01555 [bacterium]|nr:hypothetical protein [bacterium]
MWLVDEVKKRLEVTLVSVMMLDEEKRELYIVESSGLPEKIIQNVKQDLGKGIAGYVAEKGEALLVGDIEKDPRFSKKSLKKYWTKSLISCPIKYGNHLFGVLNVNNKKDRTPFNENDLKKVEDLIEEAGDKFLSASIKDLKQRTRELNVLLSYFQNISSSLYLSEITKHTKDTLISLFQPLITIITVLPEKKVFLTSRIKGRINDKIKIHLSEKLDYFFEIGSNMSEFQWITTHSGAVPYPSKKIKKILSSSTNLPITIGDKKLGLLSIGGETHFSREDFRVLTIILNHLAVAIDKLIVYQKLEDEMVKTKEELAISEKMAAIGKVCGKISHDLRNPLSIILLSTAIAKNKEKDEKNLEIIKRVERAGNTMERLIEEITDFTKEIKIKKEMIELTRTLENALFLFEDRLVNIEKEVQISFSSPISADQRRLEQVFLNLISNAIQAMNEKGKIEIKIEKEGDFVKIEVSDTGPGIPDEIKEKIFEPFFTTKTKGIGLGLSIVKEIVEKHGGYIEVSSTLGKGSSFKIFLPLQ